MRRVKPGGRKELVTDPVLAREILLAALRGAYYNAAPPRAPRQVDQALVDWVNDWKDNWGYGALHMLCPNPPQPPSKINVHKAVIAAALAGGDTPTLLSDQLDSALSVYSRALGMVKDVGDIKDALTDANVLRDFSSRGTAVAGLVVDALSTVDEATQLTKDMAETIFLAYWQASAVADYRDSLLRIQPLVTDDTLRNAIGSLVNYDPNQAYAVIQQKIQQYIANKTADQMKGILKDALGEVNPILGAVFIGLDIGFFIAQFTGWEEAYVCNHQASHEAAAEAGALGAGISAASAANLGLGKTSF